MIYTILQIIHLISLVAWFAGLFYLPRLFVYHTQVTHPQSYDLFCTMERRLYKIIMNPAMIAVLITGISMITFNGFAWFKHSGWLHIKLSLVFFLIGYHHWLGATVKKFAQRKNIKSELFFRIANEVPTLFLIAIICIVKLKTNF